MTRRVSVAALTAVLPLALMSLSAFTQAPTGAGASSASPSAPAQAPSAPPPRQTPLPTPPSAAPAPPQTAPASLADFAWLAGRWQGDWGPRIAQQVWMPPKGGVMLGTFQLTENGDNLVIELFTLIQKPGGIDLYFRHFTPALEPWEKSSPTILNLASANPKLIVFENPVDGQPKRAIIRRIDADTYVSRSEIVPEKGDMQVVEITYHRQRETPPARTKH